MAISTVLEMMEIENAGEMIHSYVTQMKGRS